jgi:parallel beta-helix repeat protein
MQMLGALAILLGSQTSGEKPGFVISKSQKLTPGVYLIESNSNLRQPTMLVRGNNITLDLKGVTLRGTKATIEPNQRQGLGVLVQGNNITIKNLNVHGYKVALKAENCKNLKLENCDFSHNWKQKLASTAEKEDLSDWMSFHENEKDEWLRYGAAVYFKNVEKFEVKGCRAVGGQCGVMLNKSNNGLIWNSNFSYLSAIGVGLYRSSNNRVMHNSLDYCVRGYSHGVYNRGQDSAAILVYEQSNKNTFAYNSATHSGDGFFLWAGKTTMDTGKGGCNDNLIYGNDFSYAPTNGIEATFSRNKFVNNRVVGCWHGFWTGYSYNSLISGNFIAKNDEGIAHEHGQDNTIDSNLFTLNKLDVNIWANEKQDPNWGYPKVRDTKSRDWRIADNTFETYKGKTLRVRRTQGLVFSGNTTFEASYDIDESASEMHLLENCMHTSATSLNLPKGSKQGSNKLEHLPTQTMAKVWTPLDDEDVFEADSPEPLKGGFMPFNRPDTVAARDRIIVDEWGPYDYKSPKIRAGKKDTDGWQKLSILGPTGHWKVLSKRGMETRSVTGTVPGSMMIRALPGEAEQDLELEYVGAATTDYRGVVSPAGKSLKFGYQQFDLQIEFDIDFFTWNKDTQDPRTEARGFDQASALQVVARTKATKLDYAGYGKFAEKVPANYFGTIARGRFTVKPGLYLVELTADDGVTATIDEKPLISAWKYQGPTLYTAKVELSGEHTIDVRHFQIDGYAMLKLKLVPVRD